MIKVVSISCVWLMFFGVRICVILGSVGSMELMEKVMIVKIMVSIVMNLGWFCWVVVGDVVLDIGGFML